MTVYVSRDTFRDTYIETGIHTNLLTQGGRHADNQTYRDIYTQIHLDGY